MPHSSGGGFGGSGGSFGSSGGGFGSGFGSAASGNLSSGDNWTIKEERRRRRCLRYAYYDRYGNLQYFYLNNTLEKSNFIWVSVVLLISLFSSVFFGLGFIDSKPIKAGFSTSTVTDSARKFTVTEQEELKECIQKFNDETGIAVEIHTATRGECEGYGSFTNYAYSYYVSKYSDEFHWVIIYVDDSTGWRWEGMQGDNTDSILNKRKLEEFNAIVNDCLSNRKTSPGGAFIEAFNTVTPNILKNDFDWSYKPDMVKAIVLGVVFVASFFPLIFAQKKRKNAFRVDAGGRAYYE